MIDSLGGLASIFGLFWAIFLYYFSIKNRQGQRLIKVFYKSFWASFSITVFLLIIDLAYDFYRLKFIDERNGSFPQISNLENSSCPADSQIICIYIAGMKGNYFNKQVIVDARVLTESIKNLTAQIISKTDSGNSFYINSISSDIASHIDNHDEAHKIGKLLGADIVVWGYFEHDINILSPKITPKITIVNPPLGGPGDIDVGPLVAHRSPTGELQFFSEKLFEPVGLSYLFIGLGYYINKNYTAAIKCFSEGLNNKKIPIQLAGEDVFYYFIANAYLGLYESSFDTLAALEAIKYFKEASKIKPNDAYYFNDLGIAYDYAKQYKFAIDAFLESIKLDSFYVGALNNLAVVYYEQENYNLAMLSWHKVIQIDSTNAEAYINLGKEYFFEKEYQKALKYSKRAALIKGPNQSIAYSNLGAMYIIISSDSIDRAISSLSSAIELNPNYAEAYGNLGIYLTYKKKYLLALDNFNKAIQINPDLGYLHYAIACVYAYQGKSKDTIDLFEKHFNELNKPYGQLGNQAPFEYLNEDKLLDPIRNTSEYRNFIVKNSSRFYHSSP